MARSVRRSSSAEHLYLFSGVVLYIYFYKTLTRFFSNFPNMTPVTVFPPRIRLPIITFSSGRSDVHILHMYMYYRQTEYKYIDN